MKTVFRKIFKIGIWLTCISIFVTGCYITYVFSDFNDAVDKRKMRTVISEIKEAERQDERLVNIYDKVHEGVLEKSTLRNLWDRLWGNTSKCPCYYTSQLSRINSRHRLLENDILISIKIEREVSQKECLNYIFKNFNFLYDAKGVNQAANYTLKNQLKN